jgi:hypothetical protein
MPTKIIAILLLLLCSSASDARAQAQGDRRVGATVTWTVVGAGAGFGIGLWAGLTAFDDAINSDRKVWTSALVGAAIGGVGGYLISRALGPKGPQVASMVRGLNATRIEPSRSNVAPYRLNTAPYRLTAGRYRKAQLDLSPTGP